MTNRLGLYVHVPFCEKKCAYCDFYSTADRGSAEEYVSALKAQMAFFAPRAEGLEADTVYFGGGTPTALPKGALEELLAALGRAFCISEGAEITVEANPGTVDEKGLSALREAGFNRVSLGMQSARDGELAALGRIHRHADTVRAAAAARAAGFSNLSLDVMLAIPGQDMDSLQETLEQAAALCPEHISAYILKLEPGTEFFSRHPNGAGLPDEDGQADLYLACADFLKSAGYFQYEVSNFARPGFESRHNQKYWAAEPYLGLGPSAHSDLGGRFYTGRDLKSFIEAGRSGGFSAVIFPEETDRAAERVMLALRTARGLRRGDCPEFDAVAGRLRGVPERYLTAEEDRLSLTTEGFLISNFIISRALDGGI